MAASIHQYLETRLKPQLAALGVGRQARELVAADVGRRLASVLVHWGDAPRLGPLLLPGLEEAAHYRPLAAPLPVRALVVVAVRNSLLEDLATDTPFTEALKPFRQSVPDEQVPSVTRLAVEYFARADVRRLADEASQSDTADCFAGLAERYPYAWQALSYVGVSATDESTVMPICAVLPRLPAVAERVGGSEPVADLQSGSDPRFSPRLADALRLIRDRELKIFFSDSFKVVTRNFDKLCRVIDFVLGHGGVFLTHNYYLGPDYVARRRGLLRPVHYMDDIGDKFQRRTGLVPRHGEALAAVEQQLFS